MEHVKADPYIELLFENCDCIKIHMSAVTLLRFRTDGEDWDYYARDNEFLKAGTLKSLYLSLDPEKTYCFSSNQIDSATECIKRIRNSDDITRLYVNGKPYLVPWTTETYEAKIIGGVPPNDTITCFRNLAQHVKSELTRKNEPRIKLIIDPEYKDDER